MGRQLSQIVAVEVFLIISKIFPTVSKLSATQRSSPDKKTLAEQHRIVAKVDELMSLCDQLETQLTTTQSESQKLMEAILHNALNSGIAQQ